MKTQVLSEVVSNHAEGTPFLWEVRSGAIYAPHFSLLDLARLDLRVEAHIDGLRVAGQDGVEGAWRDFCGGGACVREQ
jgi:hypothetical protein